MVEVKLPSDDTGPILTPNGAAPYCFQEGRSPILILLDASNPAAFRMVPPRVWSQAVSGLRIQNGTSLVQDGRGPAGWPLQAWRLLR